MLEQCEMYGMECNVMWNGMWCGMYSALVIKTTLRRHSRRSGVFTVNFEHI